MSKSGMIVLFSVAGIVALLIVAALSLGYLVDADASRRRVQAAASEMLGMEVSVGGKLGVVFFPGLGLTLNDVHIRNRGMELVAANEVRLGFEFMSLFRDRFRVTDVALMQAKVTIATGADGKYNFETTGPALPAVDLAELAVSDATIAYADGKSGIGFEARDCDLALRDLLLADAGKAGKRVSFGAALSCGKVKAKDFAVTDLKLSARIENGAVDFRSVTLGIFGGRGAGSLVADYSGAAPVYRIRFSLRQFRIEDLLRTMFPETLVSGNMDFSSTLTLRGRTAQELKQSANGEVVLQGTALTLNGRDLDEEFNRFKSSQEFSLVDVGVYLFIGPAGVAATTVYDLASLLKGSGGTSHITTFVSRWKVEDGLMRAEDVAMATDEHRMALLGGLDIANARFVDVKLALLDKQGCAEVEQKVSGPFAKPVIAKPNILLTIAGPAIKLLKKGRSLLPGGECKVVYTGTVAARSDAN